MGADLWGLAAIVVMAYLFSGLRAFVCRQKRAGSTAVLWYSRRHYEGNRES